MKNLVLVVLGSLSMASAWAIKVNDGYIGGVSIEQIDSISRSEIVKYYAKEEVRLSPEKIESKIDQLNVEAVAPNAMRVSVGYNIDLVRDPNSGVADYCMVDYEVTNLGSELKLTYVSCEVRD